MAVNPFEQFLSNPPRYPGWVVKSISHPRLCTNSLYFSLPLVLCKILCSSSCPGPTYNKANLNTSLACLLSNNLISLNNVFPLFNTHIVPSFNDSGVNQPK
jgi:hypothetical protein